MKIANLVRLARAARKLNWHETPLRFKLSHALLSSSMMKRQLATQTRLVIDFDEGLLNVGTASLIERAALLRGYHEPAIADLIKRLVRPGAVCLDIGANIGAHALIMAFRATESGHVYAVEPHPVVAQDLLRNLALNNVRNVSVIQAALAPENGTVSLFGFKQDEFNRGISSLSASARTPDSVEVPAISGATLMSLMRSDRCDLVKIDVEGHDPMALRSLEALIRRHRPHLIVECYQEQWRRCGFDVESTLELLAAWHYDLYWAAGGMMRSLADAPLPRSCDLFCVPQRSALPLA